MPLTWKKISSDDYRSANGEYGIARLSAEDNSYANVDEWTLYNDRTNESIDVYSRLKDAKKAAADNC